MKYLKFLGLIVVSIMLVSCGSSGGGGADVSSGTSTITIAIGGSGQASIVEPKEDTMFAKVMKFVDILSPAEAEAGTGTIRLCEVPLIPLDVSIIAISITGGGITSPITDNIIFSSFDDHCETVIRTYTVPNGTGRVFHADAMNAGGNSIYEGTTVKDINGADYVQIIMGAVKKPLVYVSNADSDNVSAIDPVTFDVVATLGCSSLEGSCYEPRNLAVSYDGASVAVPFRHSDITIDIDTSNLFVNYDDIIEDSSFDEPYAVAFTCDDSEAWVVNKKGGGSSVGSISIINNSTNSVVASLEDECLSSPEGIAITNNMAYIANRGNGTVCVMDTLTRSFVTTIDVGGEPRFAVATPDGAFVYVSTDSSFVGIKKIRTSDNTIVATFEVRGRNLAVTPDGSKVYVATQSSSIGVINVATDSLSSISIPGAGIYGVTILLDGSLGFATDEKWEGGVYVFNPLNDQLITVDGSPVRIAVGRYPRAIATQPAPMSCEIIEPPVDEPECFTDSDCPEEGMTCTDGICELLEPSVYNVSFLVLGLVASGTFDVLLYDDTVDPDPVAPLETVTASDNISYNFNNQIQDSHTITLDITNVPSTQTCTFQANGSTTLTDSIQASDMIYAVLCEEIPLTCVPTLISPAEGAIMDNACISQEGQFDPMIWEFDWSSCEGATEYNLYVKNRLIANPAFDLEGIETPSFTFDAGGGSTEAYDNWFYRVRAMVNGIWGEWSEERNFTVEPLDHDCQQCVSEASIVMHPIVTSQLGGALNVEINGELWDATFYNQWSQSPQQGYYGTFAEDASVALYNLFHTSAFDLYDSNPAMVWGCEASPCTMVTPYVADPTTIFGYSFVNADRYGIDRSRVNTRDFRQDQGNISFVQWSESSSTACD